VSFDIFLQCFRKGEQAPIPRKIFDTIFGQHDTHPQSRGVTLVILSSNIQTGVTGPSTAVGTNTGKTPRG
jgi:hypothetical protein